MATVMERIEIPGKSTSELRREANELRKRIKKNITIWRKGCDSLSEITLIKKEDTEAQHPPRSKG